MSSCTNLYFQHCIRFYDSHFSTSLPKRAVVSLLNFSCTGTHEMASHSMCISEGEWGWAPSRVFWPLGLFRNLCTRISLWCRLFSVQIVQVQAKEFRRRGYLASIPGSNCVTSTLSKKVNILCQLIDNAS